ncbi:DUF2750 domain-containing protein [Massilia sp. SR12]
MAANSAYARRLAENEWAAYIPTPIDLSSFIDNWLQGMHQDMVLAGVNFNSDLAGLEIDPLELAEELLQRP